MNEQKITIEEPDGRTTEIVAEVDEYDAGETVDVILLETVGRLAKALADREVQLQVERAQNRLYRNLLSGTTEVIIGEETGEIGADGLPIFREVDRRTVHLSGGFNGSPGTIERLRRLGVE